MVMFDIGDAVVDSAVELETGGRPIAWLGASSEVVEANRWWMEPHFLESGNNLSLNWQSWIVRVDDKIIVIDPLFRQ